MLALTLIAIVGSAVGGKTDAGIALVPQEDHGLGKGFESDCYSGFQRLQRLGVVVVHQGNRQKWHGLHQTAIQQPLQIKLAVTDADNVEIVVKRRIKQAHATDRIGGIPAQAFNGLAPGFAALFEQDAIRGHGSGAL